MGACCLNFARALALFLGVAALAFTCVGFATNYWLEFDVDRSILTRDASFYVSMVNEDLGRIMFTRHRGIFRECYSDDVVPFLDHSDDVVDSDCFELDFDDPDHLDVSDDYSTRIELLRCVIAFFAIGIALGIGGIIVSIISLYKRTIKWVVLSLLCALFTGLSVATAIAFFLGVDYMERKDRGDPRELVFRKNWSAELEEATSTSFGWSFALSWVAVGLALICAALYLFIALYMRSSDDDDGTSDSSSDTSDNLSVNQKYLHYNYPYVINEAYQGNVAPVFWPQEKSRPSRAVLQMAAPPDFSVENMYGSQQSGAFYYGSRGALLPAVSYMHSPDRPLSRSRIE